MKNADTPAMPLTGDAYQDFASYDDTKNDTSYNPECQGLTKREQFCLQMGVPETGDPELDDIIRKGERKRIAAMAMQGLLSNSGGPYQANNMSGWSRVNCDIHDVAKEVLSVVDALLRELER